MNYKKLFGFIAFSLLALVLVSSAFASAVGNLSFTSVSQTSFAQNGSFRITSDAAESNVAFSTSGDFALTLSSYNTGALSANIPSDMIVVKPTTTGTLRFGTNIATVTATATGSTPKTQEFTLQKTFCKQGSQGGNLTISRVDISSSGDDDNDWIILDTIDVRVKVENNGDDTIRKVNLQIGLFDSAGKDRINDVDFISSDDEQTNIGSLSDGDNDEYTFQFRVPADFDTGNYKLAAKAFSEDTGETKECTDTSDDFDNGIGSVANAYQPISVDNQDDEGKFIAIEDIKMPLEATCGETVSGSFGVFNVGDEDQDQVLVALKSSALNLNKEFEIRENLDQGDDKTLDFSFDVPNGLTDGAYTLEFTPFYDYRNGVYRQESENSFRASLKLIGCGAGSPVNSGISISADLGSDPVAGEELTVTSSIRNRGSSAVTVMLSADNYQSWASLGSISTGSVVLQPGESRDVDFVFNVKSTAEGAQSFTIRANAEGDVETQEVEVVFPESSSGSGFNFSMGNSTLWIIAIINIVLIVLIIIVAVRLARR